MAKIENEQPVKMPEYVPSTAHSKTFVSLHVTKNERDFLFLMPSGTSYQDCYEAFIEGSKKIKEMAEAAIAIEKKAKEEKPKEEDLKK